METVTHFEGEMEMGSAAGDALILKFLSKLSHLL